MTNRQWLLEQMQNMSDDELARMIDCHSLDEVMCDGRKCDDSCKAEWLKKEHKEQIKLSDAERVILENVDKDYKWISRQYTGSIIVWECKPLKSDKAWLFSGGDGNTLLSFSHLFQFIKWEDKQAYNIQELLKGE